MFGAASLGVVVIMGMALARALLGPSVFDRILAVNLFGTLTVVLIALLGFVIDRPEFLDISLVYALINFIGTIAVTKYCVFTDFNAPLEEQDWDDI
ncbi:MAG: monovalent cation/H+ antiporter complex subunit F [Pseudomonadota bacterium]